MDEVKKKDIKLDKLKNITNDLKVIKKIHNYKAKVKTTLKPNKMSVSIPDYKAPSVLGDENRFFKGEIAKEKKAMFFD